jgi:hypothetical protein
MLKILNINMKQLPHKKETEHGCGTSASVSGYSANRFKGLI